MTWIEDLTRKRAANYSAVAVIETKAQMALHEINDPRERCRMEGRIEAYKRVLGEGTLKCLPGKGIVSLKG